MCANLPLPWPSLHTLTLRRETLHTIVWLRGPTLRALPSSTWEPFCKAPGPSRLFAFPYTESPARLLAVGCSFPASGPFPPLPTSFPAPSPPTPCAVSSRHCLHPGTQASLSCSPGGEASLLWVTFHQQGPAVRLREPSIPGPTAPAPKRTGPPACSKLDCRQTDNTQQADHTPPVPPRPSVYLPLVFVLSQSCLPCTPTPEDELFPQEC